MPHLHTKPGQHDQTASAFVIRTDGAAWRLVLHWHKKLNVWLQFGGHVELDETPWQAITHELLEESGYQLSQLKLLQPKVRIKSLRSVEMHPIAAYEFTHLFTGDMTVPHYHTDRGYGFFTDEEPAQAPADGESTKIRLFTLAELRALPADDIPGNVLDIGEFLLQVKLANWDLVRADQMQ